MASQRASQKVINHLIIGAEIKLEAKVKCIQVCIYCLQHT